MAGKIGRETIKELARDVVSISVGGLSRLDRESGRDELRFLDKIRDLVEIGVSPGEMIQRRWNGDLRAFLSECDK